MVAYLMLIIFFISLLFFLYGLKKHEYEFIVPITSIIGFVDFMMIVMTFSSYNIDYAQALATIEENQRIINELKRQRDETKERLESTGVFLKYKIESDGKTGLYVISNSDKPIESYNSGIITMIERLNRVEQQLFDTRKELQKAYKDIRFLELGPLSGYGIFFLKKVNN